MMTVRVWRKPGSRVVKVSINDALGHVDKQGLTLSVDDAADLYDQLGQALGRTS
jgi:hypothetical protein